MPRSQALSELSRVNSPRYKKYRYASSRYKQRGVALILIAFIVGLAMTALLIRSFNAASIQVERNEETMRVLMQAKEAMIAWAVTYDGAPGQFPWPDRRETTNPNYDGQSDCSTANFNLLNSLNEPNFLGQIPHIKSTAPCVIYPGIGNQFRDSSGSNLWYAVSRNLVRNYSTSTNLKINPSIIDNPTYPWMIVRDSTGTIVSNRVAVVIMAPGEPINNQNRSGAAPLPSNFLDQVTIGGTTYRNFDYDTDNEDFIMGNVVNDSFNDKLVYITIDELIAALERRVGEVVRAKLKEYQDTNGYYPYAAQLGTAQNYSGEQDAAGTSGLMSGFLPVNYQRCNYLPSTSSNESSSLVCDQSIFNPSTSGIERVRFTSSSLIPFVSETGSCIANLQGCDCSGDGSCSSLLNEITFTCTATTCTANNQAGSGALGAFETRGGKFTSSSGGCSHTSFPTKDPATGCHNNSAGGSGNNGDAVMTCSTSNGAFASSSDVRFDTSLPAWFTTNNWQNYVYYHFSRPAAATLQAGPKPAEGIVVTVGRTIDNAPFPSKGSAQIRPSCSAVNNYLDSAENTDGDEIYDATTTPRSSNYNDQVFVVSP
jgi:hypothetical protein